jgi:hypothetical protein
VVQVVLAAQEALIIMASLEALEGSHLQILINTHLQISVHLAHLICILHLAIITLALLARHQVS